MHYVCEGEGGSLYHTHGCPGKGDRIGPLQTESSVFDTASFPVDRFWTFKARYLNKEWKEKWEAEIDFAGNRYLLCREQDARIRFFANRKVLLFLDYDGPRNTGLHWLFIGIPRLPMTTEGLHWKDELPGDLMLSGLSKFLFDLVEPFFATAKFSTSSQLTKVGKRLCVKTAFKSMGLLSDSRHRKFDVVSNFELYRGLVSLTVKLDDRNVFELIQ
jgi:hypothetical protein